jgi:hypothetical protein
MKRIEHFNFGWLHRPPLPRASCHCLVVQTETSVVLIDTGIGMHDIAAPHLRIGLQDIEAAGFKFLPTVTAIRQLQAQNHPINELATFDMGRPLGCPSPLDIRDRTRPFREDEQALPISAGLVFELVRSIRLTTRCFSFDLIADFTDA